MNIKTVLLTVMLLACTTNPLDTPLPSDVKVWKEDTKVTQAADKLSEEDREALHGYAVRHLLVEAFGGQPDPVPSTIREAVSSQRAFLNRKADEEAAAEALAAKQRKENEEKMEHLKAAVTVALVDKEFRDIDVDQRIYQSRVAARLVFKNNTEKAIDGIKGTVVFLDVFDTPIKQVSLAYDQGIPAGGQKEWVGEIAYNRYKEEDRKLATVSMDKVKISWLPELLLFSDGSKLE